MPIFKDVVLPWKGEDHPLPASEIMRCIAKVEDVLPLGRLAEIGKGAEVPLGKLATAYGVALRHAGVKVSDEEIYETFFEGKGAEKQASAIVVSLLTMMVPPKAAVEKEPASGKVGEAGTAEASSKQPTG